MELRRDPVGPAEIHHCSHCGGLWISQSDLESYLQSPFESWKLGALPAGGSNLIKPDSATCLCADGAVMQTVTREDIRIDVCPACGGVWLDGGELQELVRRAEIEERRSSTDRATGMWLLAVQLLGGFFGPDLRR